MHHGYSWKSDDACITRTRHAHIGLLVARELSLFASRLPLDAYAELGNDAQLGKRLGLVVAGRFADREIGVYGSLGAPIASFSSFVSIC